MFCRARGVARSAGGSPPPFSPRRWESPSSLTGDSTFESFINFFNRLNFIRDSVEFQDGKPDVGNLMKGLVLDGPPGLPRPFLVRKGGMGDILVNSDEDVDEDSDEEVEEDELNFATLESEPGSRESSVKNAGGDEIGDFGDN